MNSLKNNHPIRLKNVTITEPFWKRYIDLVHQVVIPYQWEALNDRLPDVESSHAIANFKIAAGLEQGEFSGLVFQDSDVAKWLESVGYSLQTQPDPALETMADGVIDIIEKAQREDGYLNTYFTLKEPGKEFTNLKECHELYCAGHMIEAAVAYFEATGKKKLLDVVCRYADLIESKFGTEPGKKRGYPGHQEIELALVKLYHVTGNAKYLKLSKYFIDERGREPYYFELEKKERGDRPHFGDYDRFDRQYAQTHTPVREQDSAVGHAVRAVYMYSAMADIAAETNDAELLKACERLWDNIVWKKLYINGGIGSSAFHEGFTFDYDLPNDTVYAETCASVGLVFFAHRMLQMEPKSVYADVMEQTLYNLLLGSMSQDGKSFFYVNPLEAYPLASGKNPDKRHVKVVRQKWFGCACCPPNLTRLLASIGEYIASENEDSVFLHLYIGGEINCRIKGRDVKLIQETNYPWDGKVGIQLWMPGENAFRLCLRLPGWCRDARLSVNGEPVCIRDKVKDGYIMLDRLWKNADSIQLEFAMDIRRVKCNPEVRSNIGKAAVCRGPLVYCLEQADNGPGLQRISLLKDQDMQLTFDKDLLNGINVISADAEFNDDNWGSDLYRSAAPAHTVQKKVRLIPYFAWANRGPGEMLVWIPEK